MRKILAHAPHASVEERVWSFVVDQRKRIPQYAADGLHAHHDAQDDATPTSRSPEAHMNINGSPMLHPRVPLHENKPQKRVEQENTQPAACQSGMRPAEPKKRKAKLPKIPVKTERIEDEHAARLTERRERRRAKREIVKPKEVVQDEDCESNGSDGKARKKKLKPKKATALPAGLALMNSFSSKNLTRDRLTLRAEPRSAGMFSKGKASSKVKTRGTKPTPRAFDEHEFLNKSRARTASSSDTESSSPATAPAAQRSRFFLKPPRMEAEEPVRKKRHVEQQDECETDTGNALSDDKPAGPVSEIRSIEREFLEPEAAQSQQEPAPTDHTSPRDAHPADDIRSVLTMNTQYRLRLPMCADIAAFNHTAQSQLSLPRTSRVHVAAESSHHASIDLASESDLQEDDAPAVREQARHSFKRHGGAEDAASEFLFSPQAPLDPHPHETPPARGAGRAASFQDEEGTSDRLLDDLDYLLEKHQQLLEATQWVAQDYDADTGNEEMDAREAELLGCGGDVADTWTNDDGDALLFEPAFAHAGNVDARYERLLPDESRVVWNSYMGRFMTVAQDERVMDGEQQSDWQFEDTDAGDVIAEDEQDYSPDVRLFEAEEMLVDEYSHSHSDSSSSAEVGTTSVAGAAAFTEGRSLLLGLGSRPTAQDIQFEWHPYRLG